MADPLSTTITVIALIKLSSEVIGFIKSLAGAKKDRTRLREEIRSCEFILQQIIDEIDDAERGTAWIAKKKALESPGGPLDQLWKILSIVGTRLTPQKGAKTAPMSRKWPFTAKEVERFINEIQRGKTLLNVALTSDQRKLVQDIGNSRLQQGKQVSNIERIVNTMGQEQQDYGQTILEWITPVDYAAQQTDILNRRQRGTGNWLLDTDEFQQWVDGEKRTLFCQGAPGAGKTTLTSVVVDHLERKFTKNDGICTVYLYCNFRRHSEQKVEDLMASLLRQLSHAHLRMPQSVKALYELHKPKGTRPSLDQISRAVHSLASQFSKVFVVVDGLDECQVSGDAQEKLIEEIFSLQAESAVNFLATSRSNANIVRRFEGKPSLEIRANAEDVEKYLQSHMGILPSFVSLERNQKLREDIIAQIIKAADGMFLLAQLYLDSLVGKKSARAIRTALEGFQNRSDVYDSAYDEAMERVECQIPDQRDMAKQVLSWVTCSRRQLTILELQHVFAVENGDPGIDMENMPEVDDMVSVCAGLVTVDEQSGIIRLIHSTTQEYLERTWTAFFPDAHQEIVSKCVTYLSFDAFESGQVHTKEKLKARLQQYPFYSYAAQNWGHHAREASAAGESIIKFLESGSKRCASYQALLYYQGRATVSDGEVTYRPYKLSRHFTQYFLEGAKMSAMHLAAFFGLKEAVVTLLERGHISESGYCGKTPLSYAAEHGHDELIPLLCPPFDVTHQTSGTRPLPALLYVMDAFPMPAMSLAAMNGHTNVVAQLLKHKASPNTWATYDDADTVLQLCTALEFAAHSGNEGTVRLLLEYGADAGLNDHSTRTPIARAAAKGHAGVVKCLLEHGAYPHPEDSDGQTPLSLAAENGHEAVVKLLLDQNIDPDSVDLDGRTPLCRAAENGHCSIIKLLLQKNANPEFKSHNGQTPLSLAAENGHETVVKLLLEQNVDPRSVDVDGHTPLSWAAKNDHQAVTRIFLNLDESLHRLKIVSTVSTHEATPELICGH
ncbi:hypothetical protein AWENTII_001577 [Aspergillus wentii]